MNPLVKFQLDPIVRFGIMLNSVKLDGRKVYAKIRIRLLSRVISCCSHCHVRLTFFLCFQNDEKRRLSGIKIPSNEAPSSPKSLQFMETSWQSISHDQPFTPLKMPLAKTIYFYVLKVLLKKINFLYFFLCFKLIFFWCF